MSKIYFSHPRPIIGATRAIIQRMIKPFFTVGLELADEMISADENGRPDPVRIMIAEHELTRTAEELSFGGERKYRKTLRLRLDRVKAVRAERVAFERAHPLPPTTLLFI